MQQKWSHQVHLHFSFIEKQNKQPYRECSTFQNLSPGTLRRKLSGPTGGKNWRSKVTVPDVTNGSYTLIFQPVRHHQAASAQGWLSTVFPKALTLHILKLQTITVTSVSEHLKPKPYPSLRFLFSKRHKGQGFRCRDPAPSLTPLVPDR